MSFMRNRSCLVLFVLFAALIEDIEACFTYNVSHAPTVLKSGTSFYMECLCEEPVLSTNNINWIGPDDREIQVSGPGSATKVQTERGHKMISLTIPSVSRALAGAYKCVSKDADGRHYAISYEIDVYEPLYVIPTNITPQFLINGQDSLIRCSARGHNTPLITWYKGSDLIQIYDDEKYKTTAMGLIIKNASKEDDGEYHCTASVMSTGEVKDTVINVEVMTPPKVEDLVATLADVVQEGDSLALNCKASGFPLPTYSWRKIQNESENQNFIASTAANPETEETPLENIKTWEEASNKLVFKSVTMDDQGTYECTASNKAGQSKKNISIEVLAPPRIIKFDNLTVEEGTNVEIICDAIGRPRPEININYYGPPTDYPPPYVRNIDDDPVRIIFNLTFEKVQRIHEGVYGCNATNKVGSDDKEMYLKVLYRPFFEVIEETIWGWDDNAVNLTCDYQSQPTALVEWRFQGNSNTIPTPEQIEVIQFWMAKLLKTTESYLYVTPVKKYLYGTYECTAKNHLGEAKKIFHLKEGYRPEKLSKDQVNITDVAATSVTFNIVNNNTDGPPVIGFTAEYDEADNYNITDIHVNRTWAANVPFKIDKLEPMTEYKVRFAALNLVGAGPYGEYLTFVTPEKSAPEPPTIEENFEPVLIPANNKVLKLKSPEHNGDPIDYYAIKYCPINEDECIEQKVPPTTELKLHHLKHNTTYRLEMVAHNSVGNSTPVSLQITVEVADEQTEQMLLPAEIIIGISVVVVIICILILDVILFVTMKKGMIASCVHKKSKKKKDEGKQSRDKKGLLKDNAEAAETQRRPDNGHKEFEYNKNTGMITGKHSAV